MFCLRNKLITLQLLQYKLGDMDQIQQRNQLLYDINKVNYYSTTKYKSQQIFVNCCFHTTIALSTALTPITSK